MDANEKGCLVKVDTRPYRVIAQENWGLSDEQMKGMHVHHRIPVSKGGTNDPSNLYVCSPGYHAWVWHNGLFSIIKDASEVARLGGLAGGKKGGTSTKNKGVGIFAPGVQSSAGKIGGKRGAETIKLNNLGIFALTSEERSANTKEQWNNPEFRALMKETASDTGKVLYEKGLGLFSEENLGKGAKITNSTMWIDPQHPELGAHHFNVLKKLQRQNGYPDKRGNRVKYPNEGEV